MALLFDGVKESTATTGTGTITLGGAVTGFTAFSDHSSCVNGVLVHYVIEEGNNREVGIGTWNTGGTLARTTILSTLASGVFTENPGTGLSLAGNAVVFSAMTNAAATETVPVAHGGTGATTATAARENLLIIVSATEPAEPTAGLIWIDTSGV